MSALHWTISRPSRCQVPLLNLISVLLLNLPQILKMLEAMEQRAREDARDRKVADDLKAIEEAFSTKNGAALDRIFNS